MDALKPFFLVACVAFVIGFLGYLAVGHGGAVPGDLQAATAPPAAPAAVSAPASDDWNFGKKI